MLRGFRHRIFVGGFGAVAAAVAMGLGALALWGVHIARATELASLIPPRRAAPSPGAAMEERFHSQVQPFLKTNCYKCHGDGHHKGDVALDKFDSFASIQNDRQTWQTVQQMLEEHKMPPKKAPQPEGRKTAMVLQFVSDALDFVDPTAPRDPGFVAIHRLNRNEYNNTIRDLVGVDFEPADDFPVDDTGYGFDNIADVLSMSPLLAERYLAAAEQAMDRAIVTENPNRPRIEGFAVADMTGGQMVDRGHRMLSSPGEIVQEHDFPASADYEFRIQAEQNRAGNDPAEMIVTLGDHGVARFDVFNTRGHPQTYTFRVHVEQGAQEVGLAFVNGYEGPGPRDSRRRVRGLILDALEIEGPLNLGPPPPSDIQRRLLFCGPADGQAGEACASKVLQKFASRAFRRPASEDEVAGLVRLYQSARGQGERFDAACKLAMTAVLVSPQFLYRIEQDPSDHPRQPHPLTDYELASRLSYFLWSSMPDDILFDLARQQKLHERQVLDAQVRRMLADAKSGAFISNFAGQWLELRNLALANPDPKLFGQFSGLRDDMRRETEMFFEGIVRDDRSVLELLDANYTFLDERLARFYGIAGVRGSEFRRVELTGEQAHRRGGVMSMASILTITALPNRTSPMRRGKFILDQILGTPIPPPPPDVPPLSDKPTDVAGASLRQRLEAHRTNPSCATCHERLDPLGFSLENYDAIGRWRDYDGSFPIDSAGNLPDGEACDGPEGLRQVLLAHKRQFVRCLVEKVMTYALGRGITGSDAATISQICSEVDKNEYRFSSVINGVVHSEAFVERRGK